MSVVIINGSNQDSFQYNLSLNRTPASLSDIPQAYQEEIRAAIEAGDSERAELLVAQYVSDMIIEYEGYLADGQTREAQRTFNILAASLNTLFTQIHPGYVGGVVQRQGQSLNVVLCFAPSQSNQSALNEPNNLTSEEFVDYIRSSRPISDTDQYERNRFMLTLEENYSPEESERILEFLDNLSEVGSINLSRSDQDLIEMLSNEFGLDIGRIADLIRYNQILGSSSEAPCIDLTR